MTECPLCQATLVLTQQPPAPVNMLCPNSYKGDRHLFEFLCYETGEIHHYQYNLLSWHVTYWPPNPNYKDSKPHVAIRYNKFPGTLIYAGSATRDFMDFPK